MENIKMENEMLKTKLQSYNTLNTFYHETRQEIASLSQQICMKDNVIADLKARLGRYEKTAVNLEGEEPLLFGPSKSLFENLCKEIAKYKRKLHDVEKQSSQQLETCKLEIQQLQQVVREKDQEIGRIMLRPQHEKDLEIQRLQRSLAERERAQATRAVLCSSLAEEADQLRAQLGATVGVCQELLRRLEAKKHEGGDPEESHTHPQKSGQHTESTDGAHLNRLVCELQEENKVLKQRVAYVESLNAKWQKYDMSREEYVKGLCQRLKETSPLPGLGKANPSLLQQEILRLNQQLEEKMLECSKMGRELEVRKRDKEHIQMLEHQVLTYVDDFKSERADRERAQSKIQDLEEEVMRLKLQLRAQDAKDAAGTCRAHTSCRKSAHQSETAEAPPRKTQDQPGKKRSSGQSTQASVRTERKGTTDLQCPRCLTSYGDDQTGEFLKHCTECANL